MVFFMDGWEVAYGLQNRRRVCPCSVGLSGEAGWGEIVRGELDGSGRNKRDMEYIITQ